MSELHDLLSTYIYHINNQSPIYALRIGHWPAVYFSADESIGAVTANPDSNEFIQVNAIDPEDLIFVILDSPTSASGLYCTSSALYVEARHNIDTSIMLKFDDIKSIDHDKAFNICHITTKNGKTVRLSSDIWNNTALFNFLAYMLELRSKLL